MAREGGEIFDLGDGREDGRMEGRMGSQSGRLVRCGRS